MKIPICIEIDMEVDYDVQKAERTTRHYPGCPAAIEINTLLKGIELPMNLFNSIMSDFQQVIEDQCWNDVQCQVEENLVCEAEYKADALRDR